MTFVRFNPWQSNHKKPFGALLVNSLVHLSIEVVSEFNKEVYLVIHKDFQETQKIKMEKGEGHFYTYEYFLNQGKGLYFYHFEIQSFIGDQIINEFFGASEDGGAGVFYSSETLTWDFQITCYQKEETAPDWYRESVFYQIFPDRFYNGNPNEVVNHPKKNSFLYGTKSDLPLYIKDNQGEILRWDFFGGNLKGIQAKISYLKKLGITALYLNPIFEAASNHRYDTGDFLKIDSVLGTEADFQALIDELHKNDMRLVLDGVFSHVGQRSRYFNVDGSYGEQEGAYQNIHSPYYSWFKFTDYPDKYDSWWGIKDLPTIDKTNESYRAFIYGEKDSVISKWTQMGVDGWRLDVADELPDDFIQGIRKTLDYSKDKVLIGEVWEDASNKISYRIRRNYIFGDHLHGVMNYPLRNAIISLLNNELPPGKIAKSLMKLYENYPKEVFMNSFNNIGTHDTERILTVLNQQTKKLNLAFGFLMSFLGSPCIYYGDESGVLGGKDPDNRRFHPWENGQQEIYDLCQKWIHTRKNHLPLIYGDLSLFYNDSLFGILRSYQGEYVALVINPNSNAFLIEEPLTFIAEETKISEDLNQRLLNQRILDNDFLFLVNGKSVNI